MTAQAPDTAASGELRDAAQEVADRAAEDISFDEASSVLSQTLHDVWTGFLGHLPFIVVGIFILLATAVVAWLVKRSVRRAMAKVSTRRSLKDLTSRFASIAVWGAGLLLSAMVVFPDLSPGDALAALGIGSLAVGLAFKDIFENFFAGILILWRFPFEVGDFIECEGLLGKVEDITVRNTLLRTTEGALVIVPNANLYKNPVDVLTSWKLRRITVDCGIAYGEPVAPAREVIYKAVESCQTVSTEKPIEIFAKEFADSSILFEVTWWTGSTPLDRRRSRDEVVEAVKTALDSAGIEIPFPYRTLTFKHPLQLGKAPDDPEAD
ncbi:MAG: mechanosensitive ion channel family protein [Phycisphaerales bacterium]